MIRLPGRSAAAALLPAALTMRIFYALAIEAPYTMNASWMCPLLGLVFYLPLGVIINSLTGDANCRIWERMRLNGFGGITGAVGLLFTVLLLYDAAVSMRLTASSSNIIALNDVTVHLLLIPLGIAAVLIVKLGIEAAGFSARIWLYILPVLFLLALIVQFKGYRLDWITPIFGPGMVKILSGGIAAASCMALLSPVWLIVVPDHNRRGIIRYVALAALAASILLFGFCLSAPVMIDSVFTRAARIELVLSNGRMSLSPQFILNILWFGGLFYLLAAELSIASACLQMLLPNLNVWLLAGIIALPVTLVSVWNSKWLRASDAVLPWMYAIISAGVLLLAAFWYKIQRKDGAKCMPAKR